MSSHKPHILLMGQTPPPWHGQAVATQILFEHDWPGFEVHRLRMEFSEEMLEVGRFQWKKVRHLFHLIREAKKILRENPDCVLFYPPASAKWVPFLRDVIFLSSIRQHAAATVFIFHASGLPVFVNGGMVRRLLGRLAYHEADAALEVAQEVVTPHEVFKAKSWQWCPCAIDVPHLNRIDSSPESPLKVLFVGSLQEGKGVLEILRTASALKQQGRERDFKFRIVGKWFSDDFERDVHHLASEFALDEMVEFPGQMTGDAKWNAYAEADVFFFPTHYASEATPIVLMEALGAGLPILSTQWAGIPAMLEGCGTAILLPVRSPELYANALTDLRNRDEEGHETARISREFYEENFRPARFIERVEKAFIAATNGETLKSANRAGSALPLQERDDKSVVSPYPESSAPLGDFSDSAVQSSSSSDIRHSTFGPSDSSSSGIRIRAYLADQNPGYDRSFGISRMSQVVLEAIQTQSGVEIETVISKTSQQTPPGVGKSLMLPWGTRSKWVRLVTDHIHPLIGTNGEPQDVYYYPKGYLPLLSFYCRPSVVTIHDTIIQYDEDCYPKWRSFWEYGYWAKMLKHTLRQADRILTVSESSKRQIHDFMERHRIPAKEIIVTYEPCAYEQLPQPVRPTKENYVIHLASVEPHKRTAHLIRWWHEAESMGRELPTLHLIGSVPAEVAPLLAKSHSIVKRPFLEDSALQAAYKGALALILPSEIEGFGLPALEAYYLGTPVCFVKGTSVEEILGVATEKGGFSLDHADSLFAALDVVMAMDADEVRECGLKLRETYAAEKVAEKMVEAFRGVASGL